jgi:electron transport complex protein RnfB
MTSGARPLADEIDAILPQTQCTRCGYDGCRPYADAIAQSEVDINRCPPGGVAVIAALAALTGIAAKALDRTCGEHGPLLVARIDEAACIGCTLCIAACPVDAIIGAQKRMHAVLPSLCSGCELCVAPCPVDCIKMVPATRQWTAADANAARTRHDARAVRLARGERVADRRAKRPIEPLGAALAPTATDAQRMSAVNAALLRARARRRVTPA